MKATITKVQKRKSKYGEYFYYLFFMGEDGKSYKSCIYPKMRNFRNWENFLITGIILADLEVMNKNLINADSRPRVVGYTKNNLLNEIREKQISFL